MSTTTTGGPVVKPEVLSREQMQQIASMIGLRENVHLRFLPGGGKSKVLQYISQKNNLINYMDEDTLGKVDFINLDLTLPVESGKYILEDYFEIILNTRNVIAGLIKLIEEERYIYLALDNFSANYSSFLKHLLALKNTHGRNLKFIVVGDVDTFDGISPQQSTEYTSILHNPVDIPYLNDEEAVEFIDISESNLGLKEFTDAEKKKILTFCGGIPYLIKNFLRVNRGFPDLEAAFHSQRFQDIVRIFIQKLSKEQQLIIKTYAYNGRLLNLSPTIDNLRNFALIDGDTVRGKWHELLVDTAETHFAIVDNRLTYDGIDFEAHFTPIELQLMKALVFADGEVISRDDIAHLIWGENADSKFSSWAIDKNISRLRGSLRTMGFSDETIVTVKRQGYKLHMEE